MIIPGVPAWSTACAQATPVADVRNSGCIVATATCGTFGSVLEAGPAGISSGSWRLSQACPMRRLKSRRKREGVRLSRAVPVDPADRRVAVTRPRSRSTRSQTTRGRRSCAKWSSSRGRRHARGGTCAVAHLAGPEGTPESRFWLCRRSRMLPTSCSPLARWPMQWRRVTSAPDEGSAVANVLETKRRSMRPQTWNGGLKPWKRRSRNDD